MVEVSVVLLLGLFGAISTQAGVLTWLALVLAGMNGYVAACLIAGHVIASSYPMLFRKDPFRANFPE